MIKEATQSELIDLKPSPYNPRTIKPEAKEALRQSLKRFGLVQPLIANKRTLQVIGGHQRLDILREEGFMIAPVVWLDLDDNEERALNLQLNAISGEWDYAKLVPMMKGLKEAAWEVNQLGFDFATTDALLNGESNSQPLGESLSPAERKAIYEANAIKQIVLYFQTEEYLQILGKLKAILTDHNLETHSDAFILLLNEYEKHHSTAPANQPS